MKSISLLLGLLFACQGLSQKVNNSSFSELKENLDAVYTHKEIQGYKQYNRAMHYAQRHLDSKGKLVNSAVANYKAWESWFAPKRSVQPASNVGNWEHIGPDSIKVLGQVGIGRVNRITFHPNDSATLFACSAGGGLWKSVDTGASWFSLTDGLPLLSTTGLVIDPTNTSTMYLLSGDGDGHATSARSSLTFVRSSLGVFKTETSGGIWTKTALEFTEDVNPVLTFNIAMHPNDPDQLFVCTDKGLFTTSDGFSTVDTALAGEGNIYEILHLSTNPNLAYAVSDTFVFKSYDGGFTWPQRVLIPPAAAIEGYGRMCIKAINDQIALLASPGDSLGNTRGFFMATEGHNGQIPSFTKLADSPNILKNINEIGSQARYDVGMAINQSNTDEIIVGTIYMWDSDNGGVTWNKIERDSSYQQYHADTHDLQQNPLDGKLYAASDGGVYMSEDFGFSWVFRAVGMGITQYYRCAQSPFNAEMTLAGSQDNGNHYRTSDEKTFSQVNWGDGMDVLFSPTDSLTSIAPTQNGDTRLTTDGWENYVDILQFEGSDSVSWLTPICFDPSDDEILYLGSKPILKSINQGSSWQASSVDTISANIFLEVANNDTDIIYAGEYLSGSDKNNIYLSEDAGASWDYVPSYSNLPRMSSLTINPEIDDEIWIGYSGYDSANKVFSSPDKGQTWVNETRNLPNVPVNELVFVSSSSSVPGSVYLATDIGVFYKHRYMTEWILFSNGLPAVEVTDLEVDYIENRLLVSTYGRGLWRSGMYRECPDVISINALDQLYNKRYTFRAQDTIISTANNNSLGAFVEYNSNGVIRLRTGFHSSGTNYARLRARIKGCEE